MATSVILLHLCNADEGFQHKIAGTLRCAGYAVVVGRPGRIGTVVVRGFE